MKNLFKLLGCYLAIGCTGLFCHQYLHAQEIIRGDTSYTKWRNSIVFVHSVYTNKKPPFAKDTLSGTAFLLTDHRKLYLVTAKHLLQADLYGKRQQLANDSVFIRPSGFNKKMINVRGLSGKDGRKSAVFFTSDKEDIAVISLQKAVYKDIIAYLFTHDRPVPISLIDTGNKHQADEWLMKYGFEEFILPKEKKGAGTKMYSPGSTSVTQIDQYNPSESFFTIKSPKAASIVPGNNGSIIVANDKLIGVLLNASGILSNRDIIQNRYYAIHTGRVIKAGIIVQCLRKLQQVENDPGFDK